MTPTRPPVTFLDRYTGSDFAPLYTATVCVSGGEAAHGRASGVARSRDGTLDLKLRMPRQLGGPGGGTNPEELFAAGFAACFHGALCLLAARAGVPIPNVQVTASVSFGRDPMDGLFTLVASVRIAMPGVDRAVAEELVRDTERICPYAKMARQGIECIISLEL
ncbi:Ohr subfamily peroxiredoxin [Luteibacter sp. OK325]|uniref:Ohr family peroxiredoxin n=1 Tax=Luteibacter sp. OK325 TaxID=2135670 RepID=UPI000D34A75F|nr:Ohr family peroxiredoxin [Luteibacter sp. OK325]PTR30732.1 Ohr subfamily peroxiredoxin [Luteibacter sp. OK325]